MTPTPELQAILTAVRTTSSNILISACAGGGKTTAGVAIAKALGSGLSFVSLAFNKDAALSLQSKMPYWVRSATFHSYCLDALSNHLGRKPKIDGQKSKWLVKDLVPDWKERREVEEPVLALVSLAKSTSTECEQNLPEIADRFNIDASPRVLALTRKVLALSLDPKTIDFDDMLWLALRLSVPFPPAAFIFLDEAQDTNGVQRALLAKMLRLKHEPCTHGRSDHGFCLECGKLLDSNADDYIDDEVWFSQTDGRLIAVGDPHQSIYGFRGADSDAMPTLKSDFNMIELPLSVSWRCSQAVVREAQKYL